MSTFVLLTSLVVVAVALLLGLPLIRARRKAGDGALASKKKALQQALDAGVISQDEFAAKSALLQTAPGKDTEAAGQGAGTGSAKALLLAFGIALPVALISLYLWIGRPEALNQQTVPAQAGMPATAATSAPAAPAMDMSAAIDSLKAKLKKEPSDVDGWLLLGRAYKSVDKNNEAKDALAAAYALAPGRVDVEISYAEALALASPTRRIEGKPLQMIDHALLAEPMNQDGLWLKGMSAYQNGEYAQAVAHWEKIKSQLAPDSDVLESVTSMIGDAKAHMATGGAVAANAAVMPGAPAAAASSSAAVKLTVHVAISASKKALAGPNDTVFVYAKAANGPPMPLAVQRLKVSDLPASVELTDDMGMIPSMKLSQFPQVVVSARVSKSGNAISQPGDFLATSAPLDVNRRDAIELQIDGIVP